MAIVTLGDLLDRGREFEVSLETYYGSIRDRSRDNGVRLLTYYLARHRRHQEETLAEYDKSLIDRLRKVEIRHDVLADPNRQFQLPDTTYEEVTGAELLGAAARHDQTLIDLYRAILKQPIIDEVRAVLEALIRVEERDIVMIKKMIAMHYF